MVDGQRCPVQAGGSNDPLKGGKGADSQGPDISNPACIFIANTTQASITELLEYLFSRHELGGDLTGTYLPYLHLLNWRYGR